MSSCYLLERLSQVLLGGVQRRGHGSDFDPERLGNREVVEVEVEAKKERVSLPRREPTHCRTHLGVRRLRFPDDVIRFVELVFAGGRAGVMSRVQDAAADPRFERSGAAEAGLRTDRASEAFLNCVAGKLRVRCSGEGEAEEVPGPITVDGLDRLDRYGL